jgi:hypothetical protein
MLSAILNGIFIAMLRFLVMMLKLVGSKPVLIPAELVSRIFIKDEETVLRKLSIKCLAHFLSFDNVRWYMPSSVAFSIY